MPTNLGVRPNTAPLPTGTAVKKRGKTGAGVGSAYPAPDNFILPGDGSGALIGPFNRPERFWLHAGASIISYQPSGWIRYDYKLRLVTGGGYNNDLNGSQTHQKANVWGGSATDPWWGTSVEALFYCEANTDYTVYLLSASSSPNGVYYQSSGHWNMWGYTIGEGVY
jgi:hypothetical protein